MEVNLSSLNHENTRPVMMSTRNSTFGGVPKSIDYSSNNSSSFIASYQNNNNASFFCPTSTTTLPLLQQQQQQQQQNIAAPRVSASVNPSPYDQSVGVAASNSFTCFGKKFGEEPDISPGERRNKRMIKNRESAARSRARKQEMIAYTIELEQQVQLLEEENARLRRQQQESKKLMYFLIKYITFSQVANFA
ncbi:basic leucine zipper transcription factor [Medicago truncatula]|uniref:Basic leucine zipper transcription factor n=1 Tax=Medicago truncatula TaxID=3880 RepID=A0A072TWD0_MEDTR|nr:basic leucine zipper transcription factor [Medicago truncatula]